MTLRIGYVRCLDVEPFYVDMARRGLILTELAPHAVASAAASGEIDAGPVPLMDSVHLADHFQPVAGFCVASVLQAGSCLLYATKPIAALAGARIGINDEASTAWPLLHVLLRVKYQLQPAAYGPLQEAPDAFLLTGNQALRQRLGMSGFPYRYDLGAEWHAWTGLPFVFSRWLVRNEVDGGDRALLEEALYVGLEEGVDALCQVAEPRPELLMLPRDIVQYIQGLRYYMGRAEQQGMDLFWDYWQQLES